MQFITRIYYFQYLKRINMLFYIQNWPKGIDFGNGTEDLFEKT